MKLRSILLLSLALSLPALGCQRATDTSQGKKASASRVAAVQDNPNAPTLEMFVMSQCPYGVQVVNAVAPVKQQLGNAMNLKLYYIGDGTPGNFTALHGPSEVKGNIAQLCAMDIAPDKYLDLILCQNRNPRAVDTNWAECATEVGVDVAAMTQCVDGERGQTLLGASHEESKKRGVTGSPTMFLDGKPYEGGRKTRDFMRAMCEAQKGDKPEACKNLPVPPPVHAIFLSDKRCKECDIAGLEPRIKSELGGLVVKHVDYMTDEGKALYAEVKAASPEFTYLPAVLFDADIEKDQEGYLALQRYLRPVGKYKELQLGGQFDPTAEICDNQADDDGDSKVDCADDGCTESLICRETKPKTLDLFVMSQCPYGAQAMIAAKDVVDHFGKDITLNVHFIGDEAGGQLTSLHGPPEVEEDIREICAAEKYRKDHQFMRYLACRSKDYRNMDWQPCAKEAGMDPAVIQKCYDGEGKELLRKSFAFSKRLGIGASPTFLGNNKREFNAIAATDIQTQFCQDNPDVAGCKNPIASTAGAAAAAAGGGACQ